MTPKQKREHASRLAAAQIKIDDINSEIDGLRDAISELQDQIATKHQERLRATVDKEAIEAEPLIASLTPEQVDFMRRQLWRCPDANEAVIATTLGRRRFLKRVLCRNRRGTWKEWDVTDKGRLVWKILTRHH